MTTTTGSATIHIAASGSEGHSSHALLAVFVLAVPTLRTAQLTMQTYGNLNFEQDAPGQPPVVAAVAAEPDLAAYSGSDEATAVAMADPRRYGPGHTRHSLTTAGRRAG